MENKLKILQDLLALETVNDHEERSAKYIEDLFKDYDNVDTEIIPSYPGRSNIIVKVKGKEEGRVFAFSGHLDVVAAGEGWSYPPFEGTQEGNKVYGRGTSDMLGGVAASLYALLEILEGGAVFPGELWFIGTVGEEVGMQGALDLVEGGYLDKVDGILIPEPTKRDGENQAIFASKGSIMYRVEARGKTAHSSMPSLGINAIMAIVDFAREVQDKFDQVSQNPLYHNDNLGETLHVFSLIKGGLQINSVPDRASLGGNIRTVPEFGSQASMEILEEVAKKNNLDESKAKLTIHYDQVLDPAESGRDNRLIRALKEAGKGKNIQVRPLVGTCELSRYIHLGEDVELVVYGPGLTKQAHMVDEYIELDEYLETIDLFKKTALGFLQS